MTEETTAQEEVNPFVKRVATVHPGDVVIFKYTRQALTGEQYEEIKTALDPKMGDIPYIVVGADFDITVLKRAKGGYDGPLIA